MRVSLAKVGVSWCKRQPCAEASKTRPGRGGGMHHERGAFCSAQHSTPCEALRVIVAPRRATPRPAPMRCCYPTTNYQFTLPEHRNRGRRERNAAKRCAFCSAQPPLRGAARHKFLSTVLFATPLGHERWVAVKAAAAYPSTGRRR